jgi:hypothetical protein
MSANVHGLDLGDCSGNSGLWFLQANEPQMHEEKSVICYEELREQYAKTGM